jgi:hypothetical protein
LIFFDFKFDGLDADFLSFFEKGEHNLEKEFADLINFTFLRSMRFFFWNYKQIKFLLVEKERFQNQ